MNIYPSSEIKQSLGRPGLFSKPQKLSPLIHFESTDHRFEGVHHLPFGIVVLPKGLKFYDQKKTTQIGFRFDEMKGYSISFLGDAVSITFHSSMGKNVVLGFAKSHLNKVIPFFRALELKELKDTRPEQEIQLSIQDEIDIFKSFNEGPVNLEKDLIDGHGFGNVSRLSIKGNTLSWRGNEFDLSTAFGFKSGRVVTDVENIKVSDLFETWIYPRGGGKAFHIKFNSVIGTMDSGERLKRNEEFQGELNQALYNTICMGQAVEWLTRLKNNEIIDFKDFKMTRQGLIMNPKRNPVLVYWDELVVYTGTIIRWPYSKTVFLILEDLMDTRQIPIVTLILWMQSSEDRLFAFCGKPYIEYKKAHQLN